MYTYIPCMIAFCYIHTYVQRACCAACGALLLIFSTHHSVSHIDITYSAHVFVREIWKFSTSLTKIAVSHGGFYIVPACHSSLLSLLFARQPLHFSAHFYFLLFCLPLAAVFLPTWCILTQWVWKLCMSSHKTVYVSSCVGVCCICQLHSCRVIIRLTPWRVALKCCCNFNTI